MIDLIIKFISWIKDTIGLVISLPAKVSAVISGFAGFLSFLPGGLGTIIVGFVLTCVVFAIIYAIVKLVTNLL